jgi:hypothetical protein
MTVQVQATQSQFNARPARLTGSAASSMFVVARRVRLADHSLLDRCDAAYAAVAEVWFPLDDEAKAEKASRLVVWDKLRDEAARLSLVVGLVGPGSPAARYAVQHEVKALVWQQLDEGNWAVVLEAFGGKLWDVVVRLDAPLAERWAGLVGS